MIFGNRYVVVKHIFHENWYVIRAFIFFNIPITTFFFSAFNEYFKTKERAEHVCRNINNGIIKLEKI